MARHELLDNVVHKDLCVDTRFGAGLGDPAGLVPVWPTEFAELQREYPIFLQKGEGESEYHAVALLGFDASENLFLDGDRWNANYLPGAVVRGPFSIGFRDPVPGGSLEPEPVVHVDMEHPRVARDGEGVAVFMPKGGHSPYLDHVITVLKGIHDGVAAARAMFATLDGSACSSRWTWTCVSTRPWRPRRRPAARPRPLPRSNRAAARAASRRAARAST